VLLRELARRKGIAVLGLPGPATERPGPDRGATEILEEVGASDTVGQSVIAPSAPTAPSR
jgi:hypothetical protein